MKKSLLPVATLLFSSSLMMALKTPAELQDLKMKQQRAFASHSSSNINTPASSTNSTPANSPVDSRFVEYMRALKRLSTGK